MATLAEALKSGLPMKRPADKDWTHPEFQKQRYYSSDDVLAIDWQIRRAPLRYEGSANLSDNPCLHMDKSWAGRKVKIIIEEIV